MQLCIYESVKTSKFVTNFCGQNLVFKKLTRLIW